MRLIIASLGTGITTMKLFLWLKRLTIWTHWTRPFHKVEYSSILNLSSGCAKLCFQFQKCFIRGIKITLGTMLLDVKQNTVKTSHVCKRFALLNPAEKRSYVCVWTPAQLCRRTFFDHWVITYAMKVKSSSSLYLEFVPVLLKVSKCQSE